MNTTDDSAPTQPMSDSSDSPSSDEVPHDSISRREEAVTLLDGLLAVVRNASIIIACVIIFGGGGIAYALLASSEYTSTVRVVREAPSDAPPMSLGGGGLSALQGLGIGIGGSSGGLSPEAFPAVLESKEVRLAVSRDTFRIGSRDNFMTLVEFASRPGFLDQFFAGGEIHRVRKGKGLTDEERAAVGFVKEVTSSSINPENGIMSIDVTTHDPELSLGVAESIVSHLRQRVRSIRTKKTRKNLDFIEGRFREAEKELRAAEKSLAEFVERNKQINSAQLRTQRDRLERKVSFKSNLYRQLQSQVTQARIDLQKREPVVTEVEGPNYPSSSSGPRRLLLIILGVGFGGALGIVLAFLRAYLKTVQQREGEKVDEVKRKLKEETSNSIIMSLVRKISK